MISAYQTSACPPLATCQVPSLGVMTSALLRDPTVYIDSVTACIQFEHAGLVTPAALAHASLAWFLHLKQHQCTLNGKL